VLAELTDDDEFDRAIASSAAKLTGLAEAALAEHRAGVTHTDGIDVLERDSSLRSECRVPRGRLPLTDTPLPTHRYAAGDLPQMRRRQASRWSLFRAFSRMISAATWRLVLGTVTRTFRRPFGL
jgi:hypothetical protein